MRPFQIALMVMLFASTFIASAGPEGPGTPPSRDAIDEFGGGVSAGLPSTGDYNCVAVGDIDKDGKADIVLGAEQNYGESGTTGLYAFFGSGDGTWTQRTISSANSFAAMEVADCDNDGSREVFAAYQEYSNGVGAWEWTGSTFAAGGISSPHTSGAVSYIRIANVSGGAGSDLVVASQNGMRYYEGSGRSPISWTQYSNGLSTNGFFTGMDIADLDNDGLVDIAAGQYGDGVLLYQQSSPGRAWTDVSSTLPDTERSGRILGLVAGDVNSDGNVDLIFSRRTTPTGLYMLLGNGGGPSGNDLKWTYANASWARHPDGTYYQMQLRDVDRDGDLDLLAPCEDYGLHLYLGNGAEDPGTAFKWTEVTGKGLPTDKRFFGSNFLDLDSDGDLDIAGCTWGNGAMVLRNNITQPEEPTARAGRDQTVFLGNTTHLNGTASSDAQDCPGGDPSGDILSYDWNLTSQPAGSTMSDADLDPSDSAASPSFTPTHPGNYTFTLSVADTGGHRSAAEDEVGISVVLVNTPPTADAGMDRTVPVGDNVTLDGSGSSDLEDAFELLGYMWEPSPSNPTAVTLRDDASATPWFIAPNTTGNYSFDLTVTDSWGASSGPDSVRIEVVLPPNLRPSANAGPDIEAVANSTVYLDGSLSYDHDGSIVGWSWECTSHPSLEISDRDTPRPHFFPRTMGTYEFMLVVEDDRGDRSEPDRVAVTVIPDNLPPVANAGKNQTVHRNSTVVLNGSLSSDSDGLISVWNWTCTSHPSIVLTGPNSSQPSFEAGEVGEVDFTLTVMDDDGAWSGPDTVKVTVVEEDVDIPDPVENHPPTVDLLFPTQGAVLNRTVRIAWTADDEDGDPLSVSVVLVNGTGASDVLFEGPMTDEHLDWNTSGHANGTYFITITVDDGEGSSSDYSGAFQVRNVPPAGNGTDGDPPDEPPIGTDDGGGFPTYLLFIALVLIALAALSSILIIGWIARRSRTDGALSWDEE